MAKKSKTRTAEDAKEQVNKRTDDLIDDDGEIDLDFDENGLLTKVDSVADRNLAARRRLEDYLEEKRLRNEIMDDFDY